MDDFSTLYPRLKINILDNPGRIVPMGMNVALRQAYGDIIICVHGHYILASDALCIGLTLFKKTVQIALAGRWIPW